MTRPKHGSSTYAEALGAVSVVELTTGEPPTSQFPVVSHEMFHAWFASAPVPDQVHRKP